MSKGKNKKMKTMKIYLLLLPLLPSQDWGFVATPHPPTFFMAKIFKNFFIDTWVYGQRVGKLTVQQSSRMLPWEILKISLSENVFSGF